jgi:hypothetical protein
MENVINIGLGGEAAQGGGVVFREGRLDGSDAEVFVTPGEVCAGGGDSGFCVTWNSCVAIEDEVAVWCGAAGVDLGAGETGKKEGQDEGSTEETLADRVSSLDSASGRKEN